MIKVVAATQNAHKIKELTKIVQGFDMEIISQKDAGLEKIDVEEDGDTFEENSEKKARTIMELSGMPAIADDSGLVADALDGAPGVYSARFAGIDATDDQNNEKLLAMLAGSANRNAKFVSVITLIFPDGKKISARGECKGTIIEKVKGKNGFGYDPLFVPEGYEKTFGELPEELKNKISHRANAMDDLKKKLTGGQIC